MIIILFYYNITLSLTMLLNGVLGFWVRAQEGQGGLEGRVGRHGAYATVYSLVPSLKLLPFLLWLSVLVGGCASFRSTGVDGASDAGAHATAEGAARIDGGDGGCPSQAATCAGKCGQLLNPCGQLVDCGGCSIGMDSGGGGKPNVWAPARARAARARRAARATAATGCAPPRRVGRASAARRACAGATRRRAAAAAAAPPARAATRRAHAAKGGVTCTSCASGKACGVDCGVCGGSGQPCCGGATCAFP